jgi:hypothetical protein
VRDAAGKAVSSVLLCTIVFFGLAGCRSSGGGGTAPPAAQSTAVGVPPPRPTQAEPTKSPRPPAATDLGSSRQESTNKTSSVAGALTMPAGSSLVVRGLYLGWSGPCKISPPTRSAWQLADAEAVGAPCVYVSGPMVRGVSPANALGKNIWVRVEGVMEERGGKRYLRATQVERE